MIVIHTRTRDITKLERIKPFIKGIIGKKGGPLSVLESIKRGFNELNIDYRIDTKPNIDDILIVLSGKHALRDAINLKNAGKIKKLIAGPNVHESPLDDNNIFLNENIDLILVPSLWVKNIWASLAPSIENKLTIWAAGVQIKDISTRDGNPIIYNKLKDDNISSEIINEIKRIGLKPVILNYGNFKQDAFFDYLKSAPFMIYIAKSESQGLAIQEAWARDVPTIILKKYSYDSRGLKWNDPKINAPYLTDDLGFFFEDINQIGDYINKINTLNPRDYCKENLSDSACAQKLFNLANYDNN